MNRRSIGLVQRGHSPIPIAKSHVNKGDIGIGRKVLITPGLQVIYNFYCFFFSSRHGVSVAEIGVEGSTVSGKFDRSLKFYDCFVVCVLLHERLAQLIMPDGKVRVHLQGFLTFLHCLVVAASDAQCVRHVCGDN